MAAKHERDVEVESAGSAPVDDRAHEDAALFRRVESELGRLCDDVRDRAEQRGPHGRRLARLATEIEDALLQARQGAHEAHYAQMAAAGSDG